MKKTRPVGLSMMPEDIEKMDYLVRRRGILSRSELVRVLVNEEARRASQ